MTWPSWSHPGYAYDAQLKFLQPDTCQAKNEFGLRPIYTEKLPRVAALVAT